MEKDYAQALYALSHKPGADPTDLVKKLIAHLKESGREKLLPRIARELSRIDARAEVLEEVLEIASEEERATAEAEARELGISAPGRVNETLITGWRAHKGSRIIDRSGKRALLELYRSILAHT